MIKIFDSLTHPTLDGTWLNPRFEQYASLSFLLEQMQEHNIYKAFAVGLKGVGAYDQEKFIDFLKTHNNLIPIAFCENVTQLENIKSLGYKGIKIHPRLSKLTGDEDVIFDIIKEANALNLIVLYCGYLGLTPAFIEKLDKHKFVYLHCGGQDFVNTAKNLIYNDNILLDLSYTMCKFQSLHSEMQKVLQKYPHKFCIGSDHPEVTYPPLRTAFEIITNELPLGHKELIAHKNLETFCERVQNESR